MGAGELINADTLANRGAHSATCGRDETLRPSLSEYFDRNQNGRHSLTKTPEKTTE